MFWSHYKGGSLMCKLTSLTWLPWSLFCKVQTVVISLYSIQPARGPLPGSAGPGVTARLPPLPHLPLPLFPLLWPLPSVIPAGLRVDIFRLRLTWQEVGIVYNSPSDPAGRQVVWTPNPGLSGSTRARALPVINVYFPQNSVPVPASL